MYMCMYVYIHTYVHENIYIYIYIQMHAYTCIYIGICVCLYIGACIYTYRYTCVYVYVYVYIYIYIYMYKHICIDIHIYISRSIYLYIIHRWEGIEPLHVSMPQNWSPVWAQARLTPARWRTFKNACMHCIACMHACMHAYRVELFPCACTCQSVCNRLKKYVNDKRIHPLVRNCKFSSCWEDVT